MIKTQSDESLDQRGGGGAPIRDSNGAPITNTHGRWQEEEYVREFIKRMLKMMWSKFVVFITFFFFWITRYFESETISETCNKLRLVLHG